MHPQHSITHLVILGAHRLALHYGKQLSLAMVNNEISAKHIVFVDHETAWASQELLSPLGYYWNTSYVDALRALHAKNSSCPEILRNIPLESIGIIPDHLAPHVFFQLCSDWMKNVADVILEPLQYRPETPYRLDKDPSVKPLSYATWTCPLECNEPVFCPAIQKDRDWDFFRSLPDLSLQHSSDTMLFLLFSSEAYCGSIGMIPMTMITRHLARLESTLLGTPEFSIIVATHSHCHAILGQARIKKRK